MRIAAFIFGQLWLGTALLLLISGCVRTTHFLAIPWENANWYFLSIGAAIVFAAVCFACVEITKGKPE